MAVLGSRVKELVVMAVLGSRVKELVSSARV